MMRIVGFCVGSLLSIGALLLWTSRPEVHRGADDADQERMDAAIETIQRRWEERQAAATPDSPDEQPDEPLARPEEEPVAITEAAPPEWHDIWAPFRTELAAKGFVRRLESVTGLDFRIAKLRSGAYQVAFAYHDATERDARLAQITAATGLDLSSDPP